MKILKTNERNRKKYVNIAILSLLFHSCEYQVISICTRYLQENVLRRWCCIISHCLKYMQYFVTVISKYSTRHIINVVPTISTRHISRKVSSMLAENLQNPRLILTKLNGPRADSNSYRLKIYRTGLLNAQ